MLQLARERKPPVSPRCGPDLWPAQRAATGSAGLTAPARADPHLLDMDMIIGADRRDHPPALPEHRRAGGNETLRSGLIARR
jgi:hypothetical protein